MVAIPTDTVYGVASILTADAIDRLFELKKRPRSKPLPILGGSLEALVALAEPGEWVEMARTGWPGPLTLVVPGGAGLPDGVRGSDGTVALRWPGGRLVGKLLKRTGPLAVTSANMSGEEAACEIEAIEASFGKDMPILGCDEAMGGRASTIMKWQEGEWVVLRPGAAAAGRE